MKRIISLLERIFSLLVVAFLVSATVVWSTSLFGTQFTESAEISSVPHTRIPAHTLRQLGIEHSMLTPVDSAEWEVTQNGEEAGIVVCSRTLAPKAEGFAGPTPIYIYVRANGEIAALASGENDDTPDFYLRAEEKLFAAYRDMPAGQATQAAPDAVTGATFSSNGIIAHVRAAAAHAAKGELSGAPGAPAIGWPRTIAALAVVILSLVVAVRFRGVKWLRLLTLALNVAVLGFWTGQYLSFSLVRGWARSGFDFLAALPAILILLVAIIAPFLGRPRHYCTWVCPFGSLQELAYRLPGPKIHVSAKAFRIMSYVRIGFLSLLLFLLWNGLGKAIVDHEPLAALQPAGAPLDVILIAAAIILLGIFVPQPWCRCLCPMGSLLSLAEDGKPKAGQERQQRTSLSKK